MAIKQTNDFIINKFLPNHPHLGRVLEVGSRKIVEDQQSNRELLQGATEYIGIDIIASGSVDEVINGHNIKERFQEEEFDMVICTDVLEHDSKFWLTVENMRWVLKSGGWLLIAVPGGACPFHEWPGDYWRFMPGGVLEFFTDYKDVEIDQWVLSDGMYGEIYAFGRKP